MRRKAKDSSGFTLVEMLCAVCILALMCLLTSAGLGLAMNSYRDVTAESEIRLLLNSLSDTLSDKLRFAIVTVTQTTKDDGTTETEVRCSLDDVTLKSGGAVEGIAVGSADKAGRILVGGLKLLPDGAYGAIPSGGAASGEDIRYKAAQADITWAGASGACDLSALNEGDMLIFTIKLEVKDTSGNVSGNVDLTVRCLNPVKKVIEGGAE